ADYLLRSWRALWQLAPQNLTQPILPGWTLNINSNNSSSPQTEADVLNRHSYGRQLGRIGDVLAVLVAAQPRAVQQGEAATEFLTMKREIDAIKTRGAAQRIEQLAGDVERLLAQGDAQLERQLREALQRVLAA
ncbi:MAG: hypothetical protein ING40_16780, partial [Burkholderiales bacterium]|nr:hypothetical protein [Burkholderiales bacterium]